MAFRLLVLALAISVGAAITQEEVATHNSYRSCWITIDGQVWDVTTFPHPGIVCCFWKLTRELHVLLWCLTGGQVLYQYCGTEASEVFNWYHGLDELGNRPQYLKGDIEPVPVHNDASRYASQYLVTYLQQYPRPRFGATVPSFTKEEVAKHNNYRDCFITIHGSVYDVTSGRFHHPGFFSCVFASWMF